MMEKDPVLQKKPSKRRLFCILFCAAMLFAGCVSRRSAQRFDAVRTGIAERSGERIVWNRSPADFDTAHARIQTLLEDPLTLERAVEIALLNSPRLQRLYESIGLAEADVVEAMLPPNPSMEIIYRDIRHGGHIWEFSAVQEVVDLILIPWRKQAAEYNAERVEAMVTAGVLDVLLEIKTAYRRAQAAEQTLQMMQETLASDRAACRMAQRLRDAGNISKLSLRGREAVFEQTKTAVSTAELQVAERREALNVLLGLTGIQSGWRIATPLPDLPEPLDQEAVRSAALTNSLDLAMAEARLFQRMEEEGISDLTSVIPELHVGVETEREPDGGWVIGPLLEFPVPLFDWGQAERARAESRLRRAAERLRMTGVEIDSSVRLTIRRLQIMREQAEQYRNVMVPIQKELTEQTQLHFNAMQLGVFQLLAAKKEELTVRRSYIDALQNFWIARAEADHLMNGRLVSGSRAEAAAAMAAGADSGGGGH